jgi:hypothetical protein
LRNLHGPRHVTHLLDVDAHRVIEPQREHAIIAAMRHAELEIFAIRRRSQIWLAIAIARKAQPLRVYIAIVSEYPPRDAMRLDETLPATLE